MEIFSEHYVAFLHTGKHFCKLLWVLNNAMCCGWTLILSSFLGFCSLWNFSEHFRWNFGKFLDFFFYLLDFREHYDNIVSGQHVPTPVWVYIFDLSLSLQCYFDFIPTYVLFCMCPLPPPIFVCSKWMCYSLFLEFGGEMLIGLTFSLWLFTPPPLPRTYSFNSIFTFSVQRS